MKTTAQAVWDKTPALPLNIGGNAIEYACYGPEPSQAPTIVALHEGLGCTALWRDFPQQLVDATGWGCCVFSRAGYGQSDPSELPRPLDYMTREAVNVLPDVLDQIGFKHGVLLGHSDGATISAIYAGSVQDHRLRGLILMAPHFFAENLGLTEISKAREAYETGDLRERMARHHRNPDNAFWGWKDAWLHPDFKDWNVADVIDHLRIPVLAIQGRNDQYGTIAQIEEIENRIHSPLEVELLDDCRHSPHLDQPDKTLVAIGEYLARLEPIKTHNFLA